MANFTTTDDLQDDALRLAHELTTGLSPYDARAFEYLTTVERSLLTGGGIGTFQMPPVDWWWARLARFTMHLTPRLPLDSTFTVTVTQNSTTVTLNANVSPSIIRYRLIARRAGFPPFHGLVTAHTSGTATVTVDRSWPAATFVTADFDFLLLDHPLTSGILRPASPLYVANADEPRTIPFIDQIDFEDRYPFADPQEGFPEAATWYGPMVGSTGLPRIRVSHYVEEYTAAEMEVILAPTALTAGTTPIVPLEHRRVLSAGAAYWISHEKADQRLMDQNAQLFAMEYAAMRRSMARWAPRTSQHFARVVPRATARPRRLTSTSGVEF